MPILEVEVMAKVVVATMEEVNKLVRVVVEIESKCSKNEEREFNEEFKLEALLPC